MLGAVEVDSTDRVGRQWDIDTGHDLMITEPKWVADVLLQVASSPIA